ncbi:MAG: hydroxymethylbilane synthase [Candidatus Pelagibacter sp.]
MINKKIIIGSRGSKLALNYAERAKNEICTKLNIKEKNLEIKKIITEGDKIKDVRLSDTGGKGLFSKTIENELLNNKIDIAVHALKDMPSDETSGLTTNCFLERNDPREVLISRDKKKFNDLNKGSIIGTSSFRREFQLKRIRNDLKYKLIRGNVDTRIKKLNEKNFDAIILSFAGLHSLKLDQNITEIFSTSEIIPSAGQGTIALQCRENDEEIIKILKKINHELTYKCVIAERDVLKTLNGDCETPIGAFANIKNNELNLETELFSLDGKDRFYESLSTELKNFKKIGLKVGTILKKKSKNSYKR